MKPRPRSATATVLIAGTAATVAAVAIGTLLTRLDDGQAREHATASIQQESETRRPHVERAPPGGPRIPERAGVDPDLRLVAADVVEPSGSGSRVRLLRLRFAGEVDRIDDGGGFYLQGVDPEDVVGAIHAERGEEDRRDVLVRFPDATDLGAYALAAVADRTVATRRGRTNVPSSARLAGAGVPSTTGPELVRVSEQRELDWLSFHFDDEIGKRLPDPSDFGFHTRDGRLIRGTELVAVDDAAVTVAFPRDVEDRVRSVVATATVSDLEGRANLADAAGRSTARPDLERAVVIGGTVIRFAFDEDVRRAHPRRFVASTVDGRWFRGHRAATRADGRLVDVVFPRMHRLGSQIIRVAVEPGAALANDRHGAPATIGAMNVRPIEDVVGVATAGPDPVSVEIEADTGFVTIQFAAVLDDEVATSLTDGGVWLVDGAGRVTLPVSLVGISERHATVGFPEDPAAVAVVVVVERGTVRDLAGRPNPAAALLP